MSSGSHKSLFYVGLAHPQGGHALGELLFLFCIHRKRNHGSSLAGHVENLKEASGRVTNNGDLVLSRDSGQTRTLLGKGQSRCWSLGVIGPDVLIKGMLTAVKAGL
jgi:hypothetical protein